MFKLICVTNRNLCIGDFKDRIAELHKNGITVILREKDLSEAEYKALASKLISICPDIILHTYVNTAEKLGIGKIHLPFRMMDKNVAERFGTVGVSVHSSEEAAAAEKMCAGYVMAGHIFTTDCKKGLAPRGIDFLGDVVKSVNIPVCGIGGISPDNVSLIKETGAAGVCIMSGFMRCESVEKYLMQLDKFIM